MQMHKATKTRTRSAVLPPAMINRNVEEEFLLRRWAAEDGEQAVDALDLDIPADDELELELEGLRRESVGFDS